MVVGKLRRYYTATAKEALTTKLPKLALQQQALSSAYEHQANVPRLARHAAADNG